MRERFALRETRRRRCAVAISRLGLVAAVVICVLGAFGCSGNSKSTPAKTVTVAIANKPASVTAGTTMTFTATVTNDTADEGVTWTITPASGDGTISTTTTTSMTYTAPATPPATNSVTVTGDVGGGHDEVRLGDFYNCGEGAAGDRGFDHRIRFQQSTRGAAAVTLNASVTNDTANKGVAWTLTAGGAACSPTCGALSGAAAASVVYTPPAAAPAAPNNAPVITATSVADATKSDTDTISIQARPADRDHGGDHK